MQPVFWIQNTCTSGQLLPCTKSSARASEVRTVVAVSTLVGLHYVADGESQRGNAKEKDGSPSELALRSLNSSVRVSAFFTHRPATIRDYWHMSIQWPQPGNCAEVFSDL